MNRPLIDKPFVKQDFIDRTINRLINNDTDITKHILLQVYTASQVQAGVKKLRIEAGQMTPAEILQEEHNSEQLSEQMSLIGDPRPAEAEYCHAHAIISGKHDDAASLRVFLAKFKIRKDSHENGCWLPKNTAALQHMPKRLKNAVPHSRIHRYYYYWWMTNEVFVGKAVKNKEAFINALVTVQFKLQTKGFPSYVMLPKGAREDV